MSKCGYSPIGPIGVVRYKFKDPVIKGANDVLKVTWTISGNGVRIDEVNFIKDAGVKSYMAKVREKRKPHWLMKLVEDISWKIYDMFYDIPKVLCSVGLHTWYESDVIFTEKETGREFYQKWCPWCDKSYKVYCDTKETESEEDYQEEEDFIQELSKDLMYDEGLWGDEHEQDNSI